MTRMSSLLQLSHIVYYYYMQAPVIAETVDALEFMLVLFLPVIYPY